MDNSTISYNLKKYLMEKKKEGMVIMEMKKSPKEQRNIKRKAIIETIEKLLRDLSFMEIKGVSHDTPEMFLEAVIPTKDFYLIFRPLLKGMRNSDKYLLASINHFFKMVDENMNLNQTMEAYSFLKSIKY